MKRISYLVLAMLSGLAVCSYGQQWKPRDLQLPTRWSSQVSPETVKGEYPRPQMQRANWQSLNGLWEYELTDLDANIPGSFTGKILVPFPIESSLSGVKKSLKPDQALWYRRSLSISREKGKKTLLHFGAVDNQATVYINGKQVGEHKGGYTPFSFDITAYIKSANNTLTIRVADPSDSGIYPHGKQVSKPTGIYYTPSSGIWQTVWIEEVPEEYIDGLSVFPDIDKGQVKILASSAREHLIELIVFDGGREIARSTGKSNHAVLLNIQNAKLWSPKVPFLYTFKARIIDGKGLRDEIHGYFGMRKISVEKDAAGYERIMLNNSPYYNLGTLDQGFWPDGLYTAPSDEALEFDIKAIKSMGFNTIRKHIKIEPARWYYHADRLGMLVWQDMVNPNQSLPEGAKSAFEDQCRETLVALQPFPSIVCWVLFNEKWGSYDQQRLTNWLKESDSTRLVNGHSGEILYVNEKLRSPSPNAYIGADMTDIHAYPNPMMPSRLSGKAMVVGEFGGIGVFVPGHQWNGDTAWGYIQEKPAALAPKYEMMNLDLELLHKDGLSGSIYTQPFDVEGEQNGLITYDREIIKIPLETLRRIHSRLNPDMGDLPVVGLRDNDKRDPVETYVRSLGKHLSAQEDSSALTDLIRMAQQNGDKLAARSLTNAYLKKVGNLYSQGDIALMFGVTESVTDPGFRVLYENMSQAGKQLGERKVSEKLQRILYKEFIEPKVGTFETPDWAEIERELSNYGQVGEEIFLRSQSIYFLNRKDWSKYKGVVKRYIERYRPNISAKDISTFEKALHNAGGDS